jgi:pimeloyl-ACP methyl ester carboxylesterase
MSEGEVEVCLSGGLVLPSKCHKIDSPVVLVLGHGLGTNGLRRRSHNRDKWIQMAWEAIANKTEEVGVIAYTARGHGNSRGWEDTADDFSQFTWERLADDMLAIGQHFHLNQFLVGGQSMGSATALYTALKYPEHVQGLILIRPPTAWHVRQARRGHLEEIAKQSQERHPNDPNHNVFRGAALSDLPPVPSSDSTTSSVYSVIRCPVLILCHEGDSAHPVETARTLARLIPHAQLIVAETQEEALEQWPQILRQFLASFSESKGTV